MSRGARRSTGEQVRGHGAAVVGQRGNRRDRRDGHPGVRAPGHPGSGRGRQRRRPAPGVREQDHRGLRGAGPRHAVRVACLPRRRGHLPRPRGARRLVPDGQPRDPRGGRVSSIRFVFHGTIVDVLDLPEHRAELCRRGDPWARGSRARSTTGPRGSATRWAEPARPSGDETFALRRPRCERRPHLHDRGPQDGGFYRSPPLPADLSDGLLEIATGDVADGKVNLGQCRARSGILERCAASRCRAPCGSTAGGHRHPGRRRVVLDEGRRPSGTRPPPRRSACGTRPAVRALSPVSTTFDRPGVPNLFVAEDGDDMVSSCCGRQLGAERRPLPNQDHSEVTGPSSARRAAHVLQLAADGRPQRLPLGVTYGSPDRSTAPRAGLRSLGRVAALRSTDHAVARRDPVQLPAAPGRGRRDQTTASLAFPVLVDPAGAAALSAQAEQVASTAMAPWKAAVLGLVED